MEQNIDILMITYNRPEYTKLSLKRLLDTCDKDMRVWVWHNGNDEETLEIVQSFRDHPNFFKFHHSIENKKLNEPTNWFWAQSKGNLLSKVDDDCLVPPNWAKVLRQAHTDVPEFGIIGCWHFFEADFVAELANKKIRTFPGGHQIMQNCWVGGSGYLMKRECLGRNGLLAPNQSFSNYCLQLAAKGWINGWYFPFLYQEHFDDPRSPHTLLKSDDDLKRYLPLTAGNFNVTTLQDWLDLLRKDAIWCQKAGLDPKYYLSWRLKIKRVLRNLMLKKGQKSKRRVNPI